MAVLTPLSVVRALQAFQLLRQASLILVAIILAHSSWSKVAIGEYEMLMYVAYVFTFFWVTSLIQGALSLYHQLSTDEQARFLVHVGLVFMALGLAAATICFAAPVGILQFLIEQPSLPYLSLFGWFVWTNAAASVQEYAYLLADRPIALLIYGILSATLQLLVVGVPVYLGLDISVCIWGLVALGTVKWAWWLIYLLRFGSWEWQTNLLPRWWNIAWPLSIYALIGAMAAALGPWLVGQLTGGSAEQFAIYRYGARELPVLMALVGALGNAVIPKLAQNWVEGSTLLRQEIRRLSHFLFPLSICLLATAPWWFVWVFDEKFSDSVILFQTFLLTTPIHLIFARTLLVAKGDTRIIPYFAVISVLIHLSLGWYLGHKWGLVGIVWGSIWAMLVEKIILLLYVHHKHGIVWSSYTDLRWWWTYTLLLFTTYLLAV